MFQAGCDCIHAYGKLYSGAGFSGSHPKHGRNLAVVHPRPFSILDEKGKMAA